MKNENPPPTKVRRLPDRQLHDTAQARAILQEALICHVGIVDDNWPIVIPMTFALLGDRLILHGSNRSRLLTKLGEGAPASITATILDGLVLARSAFHHSMNYRSVVLYGCGKPLTEREEKVAAARALTEKIAPGRWEFLREISDEELNITAMVAFDLSTLSAKARTGPPSDLESDYLLPIWAGVVPIVLRKLLADPDPRLPPDIEMPSHILKLFQND